MYLAIDINRYNTKIAYGIEDSSLNKWSSITTSLDLCEPNPNLYPALLEHFIFIEQEYLKPAAIKPIIINVALPNYVKLKNRRILRQTLRNLYEKAVINFIPHPVAALIGQGKGLTKGELTGDILVIYRQSQPNYYSFLSVSERQSSIILEGQFPFNQALGDTPVDLWPKIIDQAQKIGFYAQDWQLDSILLLPPSDTNYQLEDDFSVSLKSIIGEKHSVLNGLVRLTSNENANWNITTIYPFDFYVKKYNPVTNLHHLELLPFARTALDLDITGKYNIDALPITPEYNLSDIENEVLFIIYETAPDLFDLNGEDFTGEEMRISYPSAGIDLTSKINLRLDMQEATLTAYYPEPGDELNNELHNKFPASMDQLENGLKLTLDEQLELVKHKLLTLLNYIA